MANAGSSTTSLPCECKDNKKVEEKCVPSKKENEAFKKDQEQRNKARKKYNEKHAHSRRGHRPKHKEIYRVRDMTWKDKHCQKLLFDYELSPDEIKQRIQTVKDELEKLENDLTGVLREKAGDIAVDKLEKVAAVGGCAAAGAVIGGIVGFFFGGVGAAPGAVLGGELGAEVCGAIATADTVKDTVEGAMDVWENKDAIKRRIGELMGAKDRIDEFMGNIDKLGKATDEERKKIKEEIYEKMEEAIKDDPCIKAKRCELIPYQQGKPSASDAKGATPMDKLFKLDKKGGCCPGQRAHHIIPKAKMEGCPAYTKKVHNNAPTVCAEGGHSSGTHGKMHTNTDNITENIIFKEDEYEKYEHKPESMEATIEASTEAFMKTFKNSKCKKKCIKDQLEDYYKKLGCNMKPVNKTGGEIKRDGENQEGTGGL